MVCDKEEEAEDAEAGDEAGGTDLKTKTSHKVVGKNIFMLNITNPCGDSQNHLLDLLLDWTLLDLNVFTAWKQKRRGILWQMDVFLNMDWFVRIWRNEAFWLQLFEAFVF